MSELAANSVRHGGAELVRTWIDADNFDCEVQDAGHLEDPLAGRQPAHRHQLGGRGLLVVNNFADLVCTHTRPDGTTIRAYFYLSDPEFGAVLDEH